MARVPKSIVWGAFISLLGLGGLAGCSLQHTPLPGPPPTPVHEEAPPPAPHALVAPAPEEAPPTSKSAPPQVVTASWYGPGFHGQETASGETFNQNALTAAHRTLPLGTEAKVTNLATGQSVTVTINDRGPYVPGRQLDLSKAAAQQIGLTNQGVGKVQLEAKKPVRKKCPTSRSKADKCRYASMSERVPP